jgi:DNA-binding XRE family transcriptional regulator
MDGVEFRTLRKRAGLRQHEVAEVFQVTRETIVNWERRNNGRWRIPPIYSIHFEDLVKDEGRIDEIKSQRPPTKFTDRERRTAYRLRKIRAALQNRKNRSED